MKVAYLTSLYPAVSHTFILNEVYALRGLGLEIGTFSVRRAAERDILGPRAAEEARHTRALLPLNPALALSSLVWCLATRPGPLFRSLRTKVLTAGSLGACLKWLVYALEGIVLARWIVKDGYERLHCHFGNSGSNTAWIAAEIAGVPLSVTCHGSELNDLKGFRLGEKAATAAFMACVSKFGRARLMHGTDRTLWRRFPIVRCGLAAGEPDPYPIECPGPREVLCVGRLSAEKGHFILVDAFETLRKRFPSVRLVLVGDGPLRADLEARCRELPDPSSVEFTGSLEPALVADRMKASSLVVLASFTEGVPVVLMEAFSHGRPVVASRVGGIPELVIHGEGGYLVSPGDPEELADAMERVLSDPSQAASMGLRGRETLLAEFDESRSARFLKELFETKL